MWGGGFTPVGRKGVPDRLEGVLGIDHEDGHVHHVVERAAGSFKNGIEVVEGEPYLGLQLRLGRTVLQAAYLAGDEQEPVGADGR